MIVTTATISQNFCNIMSNRNKSRVRYIYRMRTLFIEFSRFIAITIAKCCSRRPNSFARHNMDG